MWRQLGTDGALTSIHVKSALEPARWEKAVRLTTKGGQIASVESGVAEQAGDERHDIIVSGMPNSTAMRSSAA